PTPTHVHPRGASDERAADADHSPRSSKFVRSGLSVDSLGASKVRAPDARAGGIAVAQVRVLIMRTSRSGFIGCATLFLLSLGSSVRAQVPFDHLLCHEVHTPRGALDGNVDLEALNPDFSAAGCSITGRTKLFCEPAAASGFVPTVQPGPPGQDLVTSYTCYT